MITGSKGLGFIALAMPIPMMYAMWLLTWAATRDENYMSHHKWTLTASLALSAYAVWHLGRWLNKPAGSRLIDPSCKHSFLWIPFQYFAFLHILFAVLSVFLKN